MKSRQGLRDRKLQFYHRFTARRVAPSPGESPMQHSPEDRCFGLTNVWEPRRAENQSSTDCRDDGKNPLNYVIRRFNLSSARLNKPQGLDLR